MNSNLVSWSDYDGVEGFGSASSSDVQALNKALNAGQDINPPGAYTPGDGFALRVESLERTLRSTLYRMEHIRLFRALNKMAAFNTIEEFNLITGYSDNQHAGFIDENDLPEESSPTYERKHVTVKYMGVTRKVSHVMSLVRSAIGNVLSNETVNGTMSLLEMIERALFKGDSSLSALQFDGYEKLLYDNAPAANIFDLRGQPLNEDILTDAALTVQDAPNYGRPTDLYLNPRVHADLVKSFFPKERYDLFSKRDNGLVGLDVAGFTSPAGNVRFQPDVFIDDSGAPSATAIGDTTKVPATPTITSAAATPPDAASQFAADDAGSYWYYVVAANRYGKSARVLADAGAIAVLAGDKVTFGVTPAAGPTVDWYEIFRGRKGMPATDARMIMRVPNAAGAGQQTIDDYNAYLPHCTTAYLFQQNLENMSIKQLAPMIKIPLATIAPTIRWMQLIYFTPVLYTPGKNVMLVNVGRAAGSY